MSCIASGGLDFYWSMCVKVLMPVGVIALMSLWPLGCAVRRAPYIPAARTVGYLALMGIEVATPSVATTILQTFCCEAFDEEWFLRAEMTLACDASMRRTKWVAFAGVFTVVYLVGE